MSVLRAKTEGASGLSAITGIGGNQYPQYAASFNGNTANYLSRASGTEFDHNGKFSCAAWVKVPDVTGIKVIAGRWENTTANRDWFMKVDDADFEALIYGFGGVAFATGTVVNSIVANSWHFVCLSYDLSLSSNNEMTMFVTDENGKDTEIDFTAKTSDNGGGGAFFGVGRVEGGATAFNGEIGPLMYWHDVRINQAQFEWLANGGVGRSYQDIASSAHASNPGTTGLMYWQFHEASGSREDCGAGSRTLTENGSVPRTTGHVAEPDC